jgi:hypothetical protein
MLTTIVVAPKVIISKYKSIKPFYTATSVIASSHIMTSLISTHGLFLP